MRSYAQLENNNGAEVHIIVSQNLKEAQKFLIIIYGNTVQE